MHEPPAVRLGTTLRYVVFAICLSLPAIAENVHAAPRVYGAPATAPSPNIPWTPPTRAVEQPAHAPPPTTIPQDLLASGKPWTLMNVVDLALRNSSQTRQAWATARAAAAAYGSKRGAYLPDIALTGTGTSRKGATFGGASTYTQKSYGGTVEAGLLLFDFGGREADIDEARQALIAADFSHNAAIQNVIFEVEQAYYQYVTAQALAESEAAGFKEARTNLDAAEARHKAGLATIADVLQAKTALSQAQLSLETIQGRIQTTRGALATAMGLPANTDFDVNLMPETLPVQQAVEKVEHYLELAQAKRPDLAAARTQVKQAQTHIRNVKADGYPAITAGGTLDRIRYQGSNAFTDTYQASVQLRFPLFTGFSHTYDVRRARADAEVAQARLETLEQTVTLQVWTGYYTLKTAEQRLKTSEDLLKSATESYDVAAGRYKAGAGSIIDLLVAQAALENARAQNVDARATWLISLAQFARDTGTLSLTETGKEGTP